MIGGIVTAPALGFMIAPAFLKQGTKDHDIGPLTDFPEGKYVVATFMSDAAQGEVSRRTAYVRYNGPLNGQPSFTIISNHCAHLGCPVQPNGPLDGEQEDAERRRDADPDDLDRRLRLSRATAASTTPRATAPSGPPVRALDRYSFSIRNGHLFVGQPFSVSHVDGVGATAKIHKWTLAFPGEHVNGLESWLYPIQPPH